MKEVDGLNYVKLDLLKLDTIELINQTCELANIERIVPDNLDVNDIAVWNSIREDTTGVFQWEGSTGDGYIKKLLSDANIEKFKEIDENVDRMTLLSIGNSAIRPAGASYREDLANGIIRKSGSEAIDEFLKPTFGYLVFQCQIIEFLHSYCGFTMGQADVVRRHFAKKTGTDTDIPVIKNGGYLNGDSTHYIPGFIQTMKDKYNMSKEEAEETIVAFLQVIIDASDYLFSLNHSEPYSYMGYACGWLRYHYPLEFLTTALNINKDKEEKTKALIAYTKKVGIKIKNPKFGYSRAGYFFDKENNFIYKGIGSIKYMNDKVADELYDLSQRKFDGFIDLLHTIHTETSANSRQLEILIKIGFFENYGSIKKQLQAVDLYEFWKDKKTISKAQIPTLNLEEINLYKYATDITKSGKISDKQFTGLDWLGLVKELYNKLPNDEFNVYTLGAMQYKALGYTDITDKNVNKMYVLVTSLDDSYSPKFVAYSFKNGKSAELKVHKTLNKRDAALKTSFKEVPFEDGDILYINHMKQENKRIKVNGEWTKDPNVKEWWIKDYFKVEVS